MVIKAYIRISKRTDESQSIETQKYKITRWADYMHDGARVVFYEDEGVSASKKVRRPQREKLLKEIQPGDILVATKVDRLARSVRDLLDIVQAAEERGASVVFVEQGIDTSGAYGRFTLVLLAALAELESGIISERVESAYETFDREGRYGYGLLPFGFQAVKDEEKGFLVVRPHPTDGPVVRQAMLNVIDGASISSQARELGMPVNTLSKLARNPRLYGKQPGGRVLPEAALLSMSEWRHLRARVNGPKSWARTPGFGPLLFCYECGRRLYLNRSLKPKHGGSYSCATPHPGRPTVIRSSVDEWIEEHFLDCFGQGPMMDLVTEFGDDDIEERIAEIELELEDLARKITAPGADINGLAARISELQRTRTEARAESTPAVQRWVPTGRIVEDEWHDAGSKARVQMVERRMRVILWPAHGHEESTTEDLVTPNSTYQTGHRDGRFEVQYRSIRFARPKPVELDSE